MNTANDVASSEPSTRLDVNYASTSDPSTVLADPTTLAVFGFGENAPECDDPRYLRVPLQPHGDAPLEVWQGHGTVTSGRTGGIAWASDGRLSFAAIEIDEAGIGIEEAARRGYEALSAFVAGSAAPHLLRVWNYIGDITDGEGDAERYRRFCVGRALGTGVVPSDRLPAATAIGRSDGRHALHLYWLSSTQPGRPLENPRQVSAWRYPRRYGPQPPGFARAMLGSAGSDLPLLLSGTAAVVGHASQHAEDVLSQLDECLTNVHALIDAARQHRPDLARRLGPDSPLKVYVRDARDLDRVSAALDERLGGAVPRIVVHAAICRRELAVEIDGVHR